MSVNKTFGTKAKLFTKENNAKPKQKSSIQSGAMQKLNKYFNTSETEFWKDTEKLHCKFIRFSICFHLAHRGREGWQELVRSRINTRVNVPLQQPC